MSFEQSRMETGQKRYSKPWQGSGMGFERVRDKTGPMFKGGAFTDEPRRPFISNFHMIDRKGSYYQGVSGHVLFGHWENIKATNEIAQKYKNNRFLQIIGKPVITEKKMFHRCKFG